MKNNKGFTAKKMKSRIVFTRNSDGRVAEYDLSDGKCYNHRLNGKISNVKSISFLFTGTDLRYSDISTWFHDEKYSKFIKHVSKVEGRIKNIDSLLKRTSEYSHLEQYFMAGLLIDEPDYWEDKGYYQNYVMLTYPMSFYDKRDIRLFRKENIKITRKVEEAFGSKKNRDLIHMIYNDESNAFDFKYYFEQFCSNYAFVSLINDYNYNFKRLIEYLEYIQNYEAYDISSAIVTLRDYAKMSKAISRNGKFEKYPRYLRTMHDIVDRNHTSYKQEHNEELFSNSVNLYSNLEYSKGDYNIVLPKTSQDMKDEGANLSHCVASYVDYVIDSTSKIVFLRTKKEESLVTIELKGNTINQAKGLYNRTITDKEREFLTMWANEKLLKISKNI